MLPRNENFSFIPPAYDFSLTLYGENCSRIVEFEREWTNFIHFRDFDEFPPLSQCRCVITIQETPCDFIESSQHSSKVRNWKFSTCSLSFSCSRLVKVLKKMKIYDNSLNPLFIHSYCEWNEMKWKKISRGWNSF